MKSRRVLAVASHPGSVNSISPVVGALREEPIQRGMKIDCRMVRSESSASADSLLEEWTPDLVLTGAVASLPGQGYAIEQSIVRAAKLRGISTLSVLDFWSTYRERFAFVPDCIAVMDEVAYQEMVDLGFDPNVLKITGNPHFDQHQRLAEGFDQETKSRIHKSIGVNKELLALYAGSAFSEYEEGYDFWDLDNLEIIAAAMNELSTDLVRVAVTLHPRTPREDREKVARFIQSHSDLVLVEDISTMDMILASSLVMIASSTVGIEALYMRRPCISLLPGVKDDQFLLSREGIIPAGYTKEECKKLVHESLSNPDLRQRMLQKTKHIQTDGKARERVLELLLSMLQT